MSAVHEYFVVSPDELAGLDLGLSPTSQLPEDRTLDVAGVDPEIGLFALVEILTADKHEALRSETIARTLVEGTSGPEVVEVSPAIVTAIQGADGDPEMEWEDAVELWRKAVTFADGVDEHWLLSVTDELRRLCGEARDGRRLYCWSSGEPGPIKQ